MALEYLTFIHMIALRKWRIIAGSNSPALELSFQLVWSFIISWQRHSGTKLVASSRCPLKRCAIAMHLLKAEPAGGMAEVATTCVPCLPRTMQDDKKKQEDPVE